MTTSAAHPVRAEDIAAPGGVAMNGAVVVRGVQMRGPGRDSRSPSGGAAVAEPEIAEGDAGLGKPWLTIVWDDPVNLMRYVTYVFQKLFGYSEAKAAELMMQVHTEGKAVVSSGDRGKVEADVRRLHQAGLWATMQRDG